MVSLSILLSQATEATQNTVSIVPYIGLLSGTVGGIVGALFTRYLQTRGKLVCKTLNWDGEVDTQPGSSAPRPLYRFALRMFNDTYVQTGLRDVCVVLS